MSIYMYVWMYIYENIYVQLPATLSFFNTLLPVSRSYFFHYNNMGDGGVRSQFIVVRSPFRADI